MENLKKISDFNKKKISKNEFRGNLISKISVFIFKSKLDMFGVTNSEQSSCSKKVKIICAQLTTVKKGDDFIALEGTKK